MILSGFSQDAYGMRIIASILIFLFYYLDTLDGKLARVTKQASLEGKLLDGIVMFIFLPLFIFSTAMSLQNLTFMILGSLAMVCYIIQFLLAYHFNLDIKPTLEKKGVSIVAKDNKLQRAYGAAIFFPLLLLSCIINRPQWLLIFYATFGNLFWMVMVGLQIRAVKRFERKS